MKLNSLIAIILLFLSLVTGVFSCTGNNNATREAVVYYYPQKNIYYDSLLSNYYYSLDGAATWDSMPFNGAAGFGNALGPKISIPKTSDSMWLDNALHRKQYDGVLLNTVNAYTVALSKADRISKLKAVVKAKTQSPVVETKQEAVPEKGLKKFFHKIFGKKKKPAEEKEP